VSLDLVAQTYYVPLPEDDLMKYVFQPVEPKYKEGKSSRKNRQRASGDVVSLVSITVSTDGTTVWYDHHEDGFDIVADSTEVWGDGNPGNGCAPGVRPCTSDTDVLVAGQVLVLENTVELAYTGNTYYPTAIDRVETGSFKYDGGDRVQASKPIAVTRGAYPMAPGSVLGGGVEMLDTFSWGTNFVAPIGTDSGNFELTMFFVMAAVDGTVVTIKPKSGSDSTYTLNQGGSVQFPLEEGDELSSTEPVQMDMSAGSYKELRWYSVLPIEDWYTEYLAPVGNTRGKVKVRLFNPDSSSLTIKMKEYGQRDKTYTLSARAGAWSDTIDTGNGALFSADKPFSANSIVDTGGNVFDWGYPLIPTNKLTPEVIIGWGYGCTDKEFCVKKHGNDDVRSEVYVSPTKKANIYVDYDNDGIVDKTYTGVNALQGITISESNDEFGSSADRDMSGARIWANDFSDSSKHVDIAAAWGQNPDLSGGGDSSALDLGTVVVPFLSIAAQKTAVVRTVASNTFIDYTIQVSNVGSGVIAAGGVQITDKLDAAVKYVADSFVYTVGGNVESVEKAAFPLTGDGLANPAAFDARGGQHTMTFTVRVIDTSVDLIYNGGVATFGNQAVLFGVYTELESGGNSPTLFRQGNPTNPEEAPTDEDGETEELCY